MGEPAASIGALRAHFRDGKAELLAGFSAARATAPAAGRLVRALARHVDGTLAELWRGAGLPTGAALVAVGGYGRGELFPHSDVDVLLLLPDNASPPDEATAAAVSAFVTACWDIGRQGSKAIG